MKQYKYVRLNCIEKYDNWEIIKIIEAPEMGMNDMVVLMKEDYPIQNEPYLSEASNEDIIREFKRRLNENTKDYNKE